MRSSALSRVASAVFLLPLIYGMILFHLLLCGFPAQLSSSLVAFIKVKMFRGLRACALLLHSVCPRERTEATRMGMSVFWMSSDGIPGQKLAVFFFVTRTEGFFCLLACAFHPDVVGLADTGLSM